MNFFFNLSWVLLKFCQIRDVQQFLKRVLLNLLFSGEACHGLWRVRSSSTFLSPNDRTSGSKIDFAVNHTILVERSFVLGAIFKSEDTMALLEILFPVTFVLAAIAVVESTFAVSQTLLPVANIPVP